MTHLSQSTRAVFFAISGFTLWVLADALMKWAGQTDVPGYEVAAFLGGLAALYLALWHGAQGKIKSLWPKSPWQNLVRSLLAFGCVMCNMVALKHLPLTLFYIAVFTAPMMIAVMAAVILHEKLTWEKSAAILAGFAGVVVAVKPWDMAGHGDWIGYAAATGSVVFFALATVLSRFMSSNESAASIAFFTGATEAVLGGTLMLINGTDITWHLLPLFALMAAFNVVGNMANFIALRLTSAATVEQYHYTQLLSGALIGYLVWHEVPDTALLVGAVIIIATGLYVAAIEKREQSLLARVAA